MQSGNEFLLYQASSQLRGWLMQGLADNSDKNWHSSFKLWIWALPWLTSFLKRRRTEQETNWLNSHQSTPWRLPRSQEPKALNP